MIFGEIPLEDAEGAILAHGVPAASLSKGIVLEPGHIASLRTIGRTSVMAARLSDSDIGEDSAAQMLADALVPDATTQGVRLTKASKGRVNVMSQRSGLVQLDVDRITALNRIDPMITLGTLPDLTRVTAGVMIATIKIISYGVDAAGLAQAMKAVAGGDFAMAIRPSVLTTATLIETHHPGQRPQPKARRVMDERMDRLGADLVEVLDVPHAQADIAEAIRGAKGQVVFVLTASATSDINDTAPSAVRLAGGQVTRYGIPVDPGNLLFLGECADQRPVIGLPGCARSPALNGADWIIERIMCDVPIGPDEILAMGVGGLLKEIPERGRPR